MSVLAHDPREGAAELAPLAGFWRRLSALVLDLLILGVPLLLLGLVLFDWAASLGQAGRLLGFVLALAYFGLLNSEIADGQTLGKRLMDIRTVDGAGNPLSLGRSVVRFLVVAVPYFLNGIALATSHGAWRTISLVVDSVLSVVALGGLSATFYLYVFNRRTRQGLHDLAVGSYVVRGAAAAMPSGLAVPRLHLAVVTCLFAVALVAPVATRWIVRQPGIAETVAPLAELQRMIAALPGVRHVKVLVGRGPTAATSFWQIDAVTNAADIDAVVLAIARVVLDKHPDLLGRQVLRIRVARGFDLGLASWTWRQAEVHDAAAWRARLQEAPASPVGKP
ncbi:MAG: RDD family protein [Thiohalocapsa sp.]